VDLEIRHKAIIAYFKVTRLLWYSRTDSKSRRG